MRGEGPPECERRPGGNSQAASAFAGAPGTVTPPATAEPHRHRASHRCSGSGKRAGRAPHRQLRELWDNEILTAWSAGSGWAAYLEYGDDGDRFGYTAPVIGWALSRVRRRKAVAVEVEPIFVDEAGLIYNLSEFRRLHDTAPVYFHLVGTGGSA